MALYTLTADAVGATGSAAAIVLLTKTGAAANSSATVNGAACLIKSTAGSVAASATSLSSLVLQRLSSGQTVGSGSSTVVLVRKFSVVLGETIGVVRSEAYIADRDITDMIRSNLPDFLKNSSLIKSIQKAHGVEAVRLSALSQQLMQDYFLGLSSETALSLREAEFGIKEKPGQTPQERRELIKKRMRGLEVVTRQSFDQLLADHFYVCSSEELSGEYKVVSTILSKRGIPDDIGEMEAAADEILPAHLVHEFIPTYLPWDEIEAVGLTWDQAEAYRWDELETTFLIPFAGGE